MKLGAKVQIFVEITKFFYKNMAVPRKMVQKISTFTMNGCRFELTTAVYYNKVIYQIMLNRRIWRSSPDYQTAIDLFLLQCRRFLR